MLYRSKSWRLTDKNKKDNGKKLIRSRMAICKSESLKRVGDEDTSVTGESDSGLPLFK